MACFLARELGMRETVVPPTPGVLSALGGLIADIRSDFIKTLYADLVPATATEIRDAFDVLKVKALDWLQKDQGYGGPHRLIHSAEMRYRGQSFELDTPLDAEAIQRCDTQALAAAFHAEHKRVYGHSDPTAAVQVISLRLVISGQTTKPEFKRHELVSEQVKPHRHAEVWLDGANRSVAVFARTELKPGQSFAGPAVVTQEDCTTVVPPGMAVIVDAYANLRITPEIAP
jgi:N-methylhydantoinase A